LICINIWFKAWSVCAILCYSWGHDSTNRSMIGVVRRPRWEICGNMRLALGKQPHAA
jgi:hypothetical protein